MSLTNEQIQFIEKAIDKTISQPFKAKDEKGSCKYYIELEGKGSAFDIIGSMVEDPKSLKYYDSLVRNLVAYKGVRFKCDTLDLELLSLLQFVHDKTGKYSSANVRVILINYPELKVIESKLLKLAEW